MLTLNEPLLDQDEIGRIRCVTHEICYCYHNQCTNIRLAEMIAKLIKYLQEKE